MEKSDLTPVFTFQTKPMLVKIIRRCVSDEYFAIVSKNRGGISEWFKELLVHYTNVTKVNNVFLHQQPKYLLLPLKDTIFFNKYKEVVTSYSKANVLAILLLEARTIIRDKGDPTHWKIQITPTQMMIKNDLQLLNPCRDDDVENFDIKPDGK